MQKTGDAVWAERLAGAMAVQDPRVEPPLTHRFHAYPARMHFALARCLLSELNVAGERVLDPFCGSGTVLVEGMCLGARTLGVDLNPIAVRVAQVKCERRDANARARFERALLHVGEASLERVRARTRVRTLPAASERQWYDPHVLLEIAGLLEEVRTCPNPADLRALEMVVSAIVIKFSRQRADTDDTLEQKHIRKGLVTDFFVRKGQELLTCWAELEAASSPDATEPTLIEADMRELPQILGAERTRWILSSPPYGGTYDYVQHHARRYAWLNLDASRLQTREIGARRRLSNEAHGESSRTWEREVTAMLESMRATLESEGHAILLVGDGEIGGRRVAAERQIRALAPATGFTWVASASQSRRDWRGGAAREEHLLVLRASGRDATQSRPHGPR